MDKTWLDAYPPGVAAEIDAEGHGSLVDLLEASFRQYAANPAFVCMDRFLTYGELDEMSRRLAAWLQSRGMAQGARVGVMLPNVLQTPVALAAVLRAGFVVVGVDPRAAGPELEHQLCDAGCEAIILLENYAHALEQVLPRTPVRHVVVASSGELLGGRGIMVDFMVRHVKRQVPEFSIPQMVRFRAALTQGARMRFTAPAPQPGDIAALAYTGGGAGLARAASLTHRNLVANLAQLDAWTRPALERSSPVAFPTIVCTLPLQHILGLGTCMLWGMRMGALHLLAPDAHDTRGLIQELARYPFHIIAAADTLYDALLHDLDFQHLDFSTLKLCMGLGMAVQQAVGEKWHAVTGTQIIEGYGRAETALLATCNRCDSTRFTGSAGLPLPSTEVAIVDADGRALPAGHVGEIAVRGPQVMAGYWMRPDDTAAATTPDGYFRCGDQGVMDGQGYIKIVERRKDMILHSGLRIDSYNETRDTWTDSGNSTIRRAYPPTSTGHSTGR